MKFTIDQKSLNNALSTVSKAISSRPSRPILGNVLMTAVQATQQLIMAGFDEVLSIETRIDASVEKTGSTTLPVKLLSDIVSKLNGEITIEVENDTAIIIAGKGRYEVRGLPPDDYPVLPSIESDSVELSPEALLSGIQGTLFAASNDETKQVLTGVRITAGECIEIAATDGHRLSVVTSTDIWNGEPIAVTVPTNALREVEKMLGLSETVKVAIDDVQMQFVSDNRIITTRLLQGQYPNYRQLIPKQFARQVTVNRRELIEALERVGILASQRNNIVKLAIEDMAIDTSCEATEVGSGKETVMATINGESMDIAFDVRYLLDALKSFDGEDVVMNLNTETSPAVLNPAGSSTVMCLVMPCQIRE